MSNAFVPGREMFRSEADFKAWEKQCMLFQAMSNQWISVNDGLPDAGTDVLAIVQCRNPYAVVAHMVGDSKFRVWLSRGDDHNISHGPVSHWMYLPIIPENIELVQVASDE